MAASSEPLKWGQGGEMGSQGDSTSWRQVLLGTPCCFCCSFSIFFLLVSALQFYLVEFSLDIVGQDCPSRCPTLHEPSGDPNLVNQIVPNGIWINNWSLFHPAAISEMTLHHFFATRIPESSLISVLERTPWATGHLLRQRSSTFWHKGLVSWRQFFHRCCGWGWCLEVMGAADEALLAHLSLTSYSVASS